MRRKPRDSAAGGRRRSLMQARRQQALEALGIMALEPRAARGGTAAGREARRTRLDWSDLASRRARVPPVRVVPDAHADGVRRRGPGARLAWWWARRRVRKRTARASRSSGRAGMLLNSMLRAIGLRTRQVYIANILKCRPPHNRDPSAEEVGRCLPYLRAPDRAAHPQIMLCVGRIAAQNLLGTDTPLARCAAACTIRRAQSRSS